MELMNKIFEVAKSNKKTIVLPEGTEDRTLVAVQEIQKKGFARPVLIGNENEIKEKASSLDVDLSGIKIIDPEKSDRLETYVQTFYELRKKKGMTLEKADKIVRDPLYFATMMV